MADVTVIGGGLGGLVSALKLARAGHHVTLHEKNDQLGGKLGGIDIDGYHFDTGPSMLTLPYLFDDLGLELETVRLNVPFRYHFADGSTLAVYDDAHQTRAAFEELCGEGASWNRMYERGRRAWNVAQRTFFAGPIQPTRNVAKRLRSPADLLRIDGRQTLANRGERLFHDERLRQWLNRYATYSGSSPWAAPATLICIPFIEQRFGCWHVRGGLAEISTALDKALRAAGVDVRLGSDVTKILHRDGTVIGTRTRDDRDKADVVIADCDAEHLYGTLLPAPRRFRRATRAGRSSSGFALLLGLSGTTDEIAHHNVWFGTDQRREFDQIFSRSGIADDPTIYVCCSSKSDASQAPAGNENWFVLVNTGPGAVTDWHDYGERIIDRLAVRDRIVTRSMITPQDLERHFRSPGGAIYGSSSNGRRATFLRASNRGPLQGLYVTGASAHPGGGLPMVKMSADIVVDLVQEDGHE